ncbi:fumarylacetoacetate hydrolase family protein [Altererythrobacter sp. C41]|uniref:fumarylacetoacetate hydrolase family protein n=1 Tax=Altererythrobacter sp. C41 TaxID=2806021 RepID=UPI0019335933|nr:fumarylacetoacetate hydrolase family protein [Altererythrobacter sp. C41]MBM0170471.1 fumarylacetoacetate hydrolase family protein [Altererythrobacter sp. C41]
MIDQTFGTHMLADDWRDALFLGRIATAEGPSPVLVEGGTVYEMSRVAPTASQIVADRAFDTSAGIALGEIDGFDWSPATRVISPIDLQCVKAAGVTFAVSVIERVIEERARGDAAKAGEMRAMLEHAVGGSIRGIVPGSRESMVLKQALIDEGMWSQYLEVAIGPDAEIFTKSQILSTVGWGADIGIRRDSAWSNPEPEIALLADKTGEPVGACLANDVNLRDFEGRSALLLGKAKDNNASCSLGPLVRLFDESFGMNDVRSAEVTLHIRGEDGYELDGHSSMLEISRDPDELLRQTMSEHHYPDGFVLLLGTLFAPTQDRDHPGRGFTHKIGDIVSISTPKLGTLVNRVTHSAAAAPWTFGVSSLMANLAARGLIAGARAA